MADPNCAEPLLNSLRTTADLTCNNDDAFSQVLYHLNAVLNARARSETSDSEMYVTAKDELLECIRINESRMCEDAKNVALLNFAKSFSAFDHNLLDSLSSNTSNASKQDLMDDVKMDGSNDQMEGIEQNQCQTSFTDMYDDAIMQVMKKLDVRSLHRMRLVSKRMDKLYFEIKYLKEINLTVTPTGYELDVIPSNGVTVTTRYDELEELMNKLNQMANTTVYIIRVNVDHNLTEELPRIFNALSNFNADKLHVSAHNYRRTVTLPQSTLLSLAHHIREVVMSGDITFSNNDLSVLRKAMLEGRCNLEYLFVEPAGDAYSFLDKCFGVEADVDNDGRSDIDTWIFRGMNESVELYNERNDSCIYSNVNHFEKDLHTEISEQYLKFMRLEVDEKTMKKKYQRIRRNHAFKYLW